MRLIFFGIPVSEVVWKYFIIKSEAAMMVRERRHAISRIQSR